MEPVSTIVSFCVEKELEKYREIISNLPKHEGWKNFHSNLRLFEGYWNSPYYIEGTMFAQDHYKPLPSDVILSTAPKCGTTWLKALMFCIMNRGGGSNLKKPLMTKQPHDCVPFMETYLVKNGKNLNLLGTHIPYTSLPKTIIESGCKIVYICREAKDVFVSLWHFATKHTPKGKDSVPLEEAFDLFCQGVSIYGPYWDHILGYWKASLGNPENIMFLKYESMLNDTSFYVKKIADFIGYAFSEDEEKEGLVENIIEVCSFNGLSKMEVNKNGKHIRMGQEIDNNIFFRKGEIGDWKNHLTVEMSQRIDTIMKEKLIGSSLSL